MAPIFTRLPAYFEKAYRNPEDSLDSPFQFAHGTSLHFFTWLEKNPELQQRFYRTMTLTAAGTQVVTDWGDPDFYPVKDRLLSGLDMNSVGNDFIFVDVGGGMGRDSTSYGSFHEASLAVRLTHS